MAYFARNLGFALALCVLTPPFSVMALLIWWLPLKARYHAMGQWNRSVMWCLRWINGISYRVDGLANLPEPPYVICSKHQSTWETISFYEIFPRCSFVAKRSLLWIPFFGWGLKLCMDPIPIKRADKVSAFREVLKGGRERIERKVCIVVFPEGTRMAVGQTRPFMPSACSLAVDNGVPVVPVAHNSGACWPKPWYGFAKRPGSVTVSIGPAIETAGRKTREVSAEAERWINAETARIGG